MDYHFDRVIDRTHTNCVKWDQRIRGDILPMFVADMDFEVLPAIQKALLERIQHPVYGYTVAWDSYFEAVCDWMAKRHDMKVTKDMITITNGVIQGLMLGIQAFSEVGDAVLIQTPVYPPFAGSIEKTGRRVVRNPLVLQDGAYHIDLNDFEQKIVDHNVKLFIMCHPHNPVGRVFTKTELEGMEEICRRHDVFVIADEIHGDFIHGVPFVSYLNVCQDHSKCMICTAPSKTFNLAAMKTSNIIIPDEKSHQRFVQVKEAVGAKSENLLGMVACEAAYRNGADYVDALNHYLEENYRYFKQRLEQETKARVMPWEGTYLVWVDFRDVTENWHDLHQSLLEEAGVQGNDGASFGEEGLGFERINLACPRALVQQGVDRLIAWCLNR